MVPTGVLVTLVVQAGPAEAGMAGSRQGALFFAGLEPTFALVALLALAALVLGTVSLAACGFLLATAVRSSRGFGAIALVILLPVAFVAGIFTFGTAGPERTSTVGSALPLKHLQVALTEFLTGTATARTSWPCRAGGLGLAAGVLAVRFFRWSPIES